MATRRRICRIRVLAENSPVWRIRVLAKTAVFGKWVGLDTFADIRQAVSRGLAKLADIRQAVLRGLARLAKGEFGTFYANLASLASPANLASVG